MALNQWDKQHLINLGFTERQIEKIFDAAVKEAAAIGVSIHDFNPDKPFSFADYPITKERIDDVVKTLYSNLQKVIVGGNKSAWNLANQKNNSLINDYFSKTDAKIYSDVSEIPDELFQGIKNYTETTYRFVSRWIRDGKIINQEKHQRTLDTIDQLDKIFSNTKTTKGVFYRGISMEDAEYKKFMSEINTGKYKEISFMSTSKSYSVAEGFGLYGNRVMIEVHGHGIDLSKKAYYNEQEVLLNRNVEYNVLGLENKDGVTYVTIEEIKDVVQKTIPDSYKKQLFNNNDKALDAFINRKTAGLNLSDRVWNYTDGFKNEIEMGLDLGIRSGLPAAEMARELKKYLREPDRLFRRVRDEHGQLHLSNAAKAYHPGAGVYRSSYKNAMRLARTENNIAYRTSDHTRWQQLDFVVGIEVRLSNNHTLNGKPFTDICDELKGKYPKTFKFTGWHPQCRCHAISVLKTPEELAKDTERILNGEEPTSESENAVKDVPENYKKWVVDNADRIKAAEQRGTLPYFLKDNKIFYKTTAIDIKEYGCFDTHASTSARNIMPTDKLDLSAVDNELSLISKKHPEYFNNGYGGVFPAPEGQRHFMSVNIETGKIFVNFGIDENGFDAGTSLVEAIDKIKKGISIDRHEEYSIEVLWHEILHLKSKNKTILPDINTINDGFQRVSVETINQLVARRTYADFLSQIGAKAKHNEWISNYGYGYSKAVENTTNLLNSLGINNDKFYKEAEKLRG